MSVRLAFVTALGLTMAMAFAGTATADIQAGDLIVIDNFNHSLDDINPTTGTGFVIASNFTDPQGVAINAQGTIFVSDLGNGTTLGPVIDKVSPQGVVMPFSSNTPGTGPTMYWPFQMAFLGNLP
jgi:hypothetical protein